MDSPVRSNTGQFKLSLSSPGQFSTTVIVTGHVWCLKKGTYLFVNLFFLYFSYRGYTTWCSILYMMYSELDAGKLNNVFFDFLTWQNSFRVTRHKTAIPQSKTFWNVQIFVKFFTLPRNLSLRIENLESTSIPLIAFSLIILNVDYLLFQGGLAVIE